MKQLVCIKSELKEIDVDDDTCNADVVKNCTPEQWAGWELSDGTKVHVASSGVIIPDTYWVSEKQVDYSKNMPAKLTSDAQDYRLETGDSVHWVVVHAFYTKFYGDNYSFDGKEIHHRDNNALNNQLANLIVLDVSKHKAIHTQARK